MEYLENKDYRIITIQEFESREDSDHQKLLVRISAFEKPNQEGYSSTMFFEISKNSETIDHLRKLFFHDSPSFRQEIYLKTKF